VETPAPAAPVQATEIDLSNESSALEQAGKLMLGQLNEADPPKPAPEEAPAATEETAEETQTQEAAEEDGSTEETEQETVADDVQAKIDKRIGKEVRKRKQAEEALEQVREEARALRAEFEEIKGKVQKPEEPEPQRTNGKLDLVEMQPDVIGLNKEVTEARMVRDNARDLKDRLETDPQSVITELEERGINRADKSEAGIRRYLENVIEHFGAKASDSRIKLEVRRAQLSGEVQQMRQAYEVEAVKAYPWIKDKDSPLKKEMDLVNANPHLKHLQGLPDWTIQLADLVAGRNARLARVVKGKPATNGEKRPAPARLPTSPRQNA